MDGQVDNGENQLKKMFCTNQRNATIFCRLTLDHAEHITFHISDADLLLAYLHTRSLLSNLAMFVKAAARRPC